MPRTVRVLACVAAFLVLAAGCSGKLSKQGELNDAGLFAQGQRKAEQKKHKDAAESFQLLLERYPNSPLAPRAQFALASSRMSLKEYLEAETAFDDFLRLNPSDPKVPDALFLKGDLLHRQLLKAGRSQDKTREAIDTYKRFLEKEPDSPRSAVAVARIRQMRFRLVLNEEAVISHFLHRKQFESAEVRAKRVLEEYPESAPSPNLLSMLAQALEKQGKKEEADQVRKASKERFPQDGGGKK